MHARAFVVVLALPLSLALSDAQAAPGKLPTAQPKHNPTPKTKPIPGPKPTSKVLPVPKKIQPISEVSPKLDPKLARALRSPRTLTKKQVAAIASKFSIPANPNDVLKATALTVRRPYAGPGAYLNFPFADAVRIDAYPDGLASVSRRGQIRRVRGTGPAIVPSETTQDMLRQHDPLHPDFPDDAQVTIDGSYVGIHFVAAPNRDYVVSCRVSSGTVNAVVTSYQRTYGARVEIGGTYSHMVRGLSTTRGRVSFAIPRATSKRGIDIQLVAYHDISSSDGLGFGGLVAGMSVLVPFSASRCDITPIA